MEDVIFAGTKDRKPLGMASVTMTLVDPVASGQIPSDLPRPAAGSGKHPSEITITLVDDVELKAELNIAMGTDISLLDLAPGDPEWVQQLSDAEDPVTGTKVFENDSNLTHALVIATDPSDARQPEPLPREVSPDDPLCPVPPRP